MAWRSISLSSPIVPNWVRSSGGCGTDDCGRTSATSRPSTMPSSPSTRPSDAGGRLSSAFVREDSGVRQTRNLVLLVVLAGSAIGAAAFLDAAGAGQPRRDLPLAINPTTSPPPPIGTVSVVNQPIKDPA